MTCTVTVFPKTSVDVIEKILTHLGLWPYASHALPPRAVA